MPISRKTGEKLEGISVLVMLVCLVLGIITLFLGLVGPGIALLAVAAIAFYLADLNRA